MKRFAPKMLGFAVILLVGIFVGIEWTQSGIERVHGPMTAVDTETNELADKEFQTDSFIGESDSSDADIGTNSQRPEEIWIDIDKQPVRYVPAPIEQQEDVTDREENGESSENQPPYLLPPGQDAPVNQLADKTAGLLQQLSEAGIKAVVGIFGGLF